MINIPIKVKELTQRDIENDNIDIQASNSTRNKDKNIEVKDKRIPKTESSSQVVLGNDEKLLKYLPTDNFLPTLLPSNNQRSFESTSVPDFIHSLHARSESAGLFV